MKKFMIIFLYFLILCGNINISTANAENENQYYAKIQGTNVFLCSLPNESSAIFEIPYSYFVKVDKTVDDYYKVTYKDIEGYVKKDRVKLMKGTPQSPYANATFKIFVQHNLYESATQNSANILNVDTSSTITYYGTKIGQQVTSSNNIWYYSSLQSNGKTYYGYIFSGITDYLTNININNESFEVVSDTVLSSGISEFSSLSTNTKIMLIVSISVPSLLILYFLIKPSKIMQISKSRKQSKKESRKIRHGDYFEFDENEL